MQNRETEAPGMWRAPDVEMSGQSSSIRAPGNKLQAPSSKLLDPGFSQQPLLAICPCLAMSLEAPAASRECRMQNAECRTARRRLPACRRAPDIGMPATVPRSGRQAPSSKLQAPSSKLQAPSSWLPAGGARRTSECRPRARHTPLTPRPLAPRPAASPAPAGRHSRGRLSTVITAQLSPARRIRAVDSCGAS
jgi:hypothetical protein